MKIKFLSPSAQMPKKADSGAAGFDLYTPKDTTIAPGRNIVPLDFAIALTFGYEAQIRPRSGFSAKGMEGVKSGSTKTFRFNADVLLGTIDQTYRGNVGVIILSHETEPFIIPKGTRVAQIVINPCYTGGLEPAQALDETERGEGGFGHTGTK